MVEPLPLALTGLARFLGVATAYTDGLGRPVSVQPDTLIAVCASLGADVTSPDQAASALAALKSQKAQELLPPVVVAWNGELRGVSLDRAAAGIDVELTLEDGTEVALDPTSPIELAEALPFGYHELRVEIGGRQATSTVIAAPLTSWRRSNDRPSWGVAAHLSALRSKRSRSTGDLSDLGRLCQWVDDRGGDLVSLLPLLPTFNEAPAEPSPYSPVSRLFWSELMLDVGTAGHSAPDVDRLSVQNADHEIRAALANLAAVPQLPVDAELERYVAFRGAQRRLGRTWRAWPERQRNGHLTSEDIDSGERGFHLAAQTEVQRQLEQLTTRLPDGVRLGLDLAVGVHPDGYDAWSRPGLFAAGMSVGAPPDAGFPSGQGWGFPPVLPHQSRLEGHAYIAASVAHQASLAGVLRIDHIMAMDRLYWIPDKMGLADGTYVDYPIEELFAVLCLESHRNQCEIIGENLGTVPPAIDAALPRHDIRGMYLAEFSASARAPMGSPSTDEVAMIGTHDTPLLAGWVAGVDIDERVRLGLLAADAAPAEHDARQEAVALLNETLGGDATTPDELLTALLDWLGRSASPLVTVWLEDLWLEDAPVNIPGSSSAERPNWQRPMARLLDDLLDDPLVNARADTLDRARQRPARFQRRQEPDVPPTPLQGP